VKHKTECPWCKHPMWVALKQDGLIDLNKSFGFTLKAKQRCPECNGMVEVQIHVCAKK
jgi:hypothetical protein